MQQQNQQGRRFTESPQQHPVYRFPQNQPVQGWEPQQFGGAKPPIPGDESQLSRREQRELNRDHRRSRRKIFTLWNLFAVIGMVTVMIEVLRYLVIPLLVYLNTLTGGAL